MRRTKASLFFIVMIMVLCVLPNLTANAEESSARSVIGGDSWNKTMEEVRALYGEPQEISDLKASYPGQELWVYADSMGQLSGVTRLLFKEGHVTNIRTLIKSNDVKREDIGALIDEIHYKVKQQLENPQYIRKVVNRESIEPNKPGAVVLYQEYYVSEKAIACVDYEWTEHRKSFSAHIGMVNAEKADPDKVNEAVSKYSAIIKNEDMAAKLMRAEMQPIFIYPLGMKYKDLMALEDIKKDDLGYYRQQKDFFGFPARYTYSFGRGWLLGPKKLDGVRIEVSLYNVKYFEAQQLRTKIIAELMPVLEEPILATVEKQHVAVGGFVFKNYILYARGKNEFLTFKMPWSEDDEHFIIDLNLNDVDSILGKVDVELFERVQSGQIP